MSVFRCCPPILQKREQSRRQQQARAPAAVPGPRGSPPHPGSHASLPASSPAWPRQSCASPQACFLSFERACEEQLTLPGLTGTLGEMNCGKLFFPNYLSRWEFEPHLSASQAWRHVGREEGPSVSPAPLGRQPARSSTKSQRFISPQLTLRLCLLGSCCVDSPSASAQGGPLFPGTPQAGSEGPLPDHQPHAPCTCITGSWL